MAAFLVAIGVGGALAQVSGQVREDLAYIVHSHRPAQPGPKATGISRRAWGQGTGLGPATLGLIRFYQVFVSSQDGPVCNFTVSCSRFAAVAIQKYGLAHGLAMASDRIQRCHGVSRASYPVDPKTGLAIDFPVDRYHVRHPAKPAKVE